MGEAWVIPTGISLQPKDDKAKKALSKLVVGQAIKINWKTTHSDTHRGFLFATCRKVEGSWPENYEKFQPFGNDKERRVEQVRQFLICEAGYFNRTMCDNPEHLSGAIGAAYAEKKLPFLRGENWPIACFTAKSMAKASMDQKLMNEVSDAVSEVLKNITGLSLEEYKRETAT